MYINENNQNRNKIPNKPNIYPCLLTVFILLLSKINIGIVPKQFQSQINFHSKSQILPKTSFQKKTFTTNSFRSSSVPNQV